MSVTNYVTQETFEKMKEELHQLKAVDRPAASRAIAVACFEKRFTISKCIDPVIPYE